jgi:hypothetical protein
MRARVVRTATQSATTPAPTASLTLGDVDVTAREAVKGGQARVHMDAMLQQGISRLSHTNSSHAYRI